MSKFMFKIGEKIFQIEDLGESVNSQFLRLHERYFSGRDFDRTKFRKEALDFFDHSDGNYHAHDAFFNNFTIILYSAYFDIILPQNLILYWLYTITLNRKHFISNTYVNKYTVYDDGEPTHPTRLCRLYQ